MLIFMQKDGGLKKQKSIAIISILLQVACTIQVVEKHITIMMAMGADKKRTTKE
jgi:hypothetical protein